MSKLAKCIKVEIPTGHVLLEFDGYGYIAATGDSKEKVNGYVGWCQYSILESQAYHGWVEINAEYDKQYHAKVIEQYGDSFPE